ncbi:hypothetical protein [Chitinophaga sp. XS-30]|uniref:hypothetical protein n=1 Tax=Chitinophaga sp. XS-30 TaxID=2604421 RepID=UPI0011DDBC60|nr:hypothetical protein [Chitinophaga sp. XS-30]QEH39416.1 hypothetical protein FW415_00425 [Chitinophaga sp. XS-30]
MAIGNFKFYGASQVALSRHGRRGDYYLGSITGDHFADPEFAQRLARIEHRLCARLGLENLTVYWSQAETRIPKTRSPEQRFATAVKKATNKAEKRKAFIIASNLIFADEFLQQEEDALEIRVGQLRQRYGVK